MPLKMDGDNAVLENGMPVWVYEDGKESPIDIGSTLNSIKSVTAESMGRKNQIREYEAKLAPFSGIENPAEFLQQANTAIETVKNFDDKKLVDADQVDLIKKSVSETFENKIHGMQSAFDAKEKEYVSAIEKSTSDISNLLIKGDIGRSSFISENTVLTPSIAFDVFGNSFKIEDVNGETKAIAVRKDGTKIMSLKDPGNYASVDEALSTLVSEHPDRDKLLKGIDGGGGAPSGNNFNSSGKTVTRAQFNSMSPVQQRDIAAKAGAGEITISD